MSYGKAAAVLEDKNATLEQLLDGLICLNFDEGYLKALVMRGLVSDDTESNLLRMIVLSNILRRRLLDRIELIAAASRSSVLIFVKNRRMIRIYGKLAKTRRW